MPQPISFNGINLGFILSEQEATYIRNLEPTLHEADHRLTQLAELNARLEGRVRTLEGQVASAHEVNQRLRDQFTVRATMTGAPIAPVTGTITGTSIAPINASPAPAAARSVPVADTATAVPVGVGANPVVVVTPQPPTHPHPHPDTVRQALTSFSQRHGIEEARRLVAAAGAASVSQIPAERRQEVLDAIAARMVLQTTGA